MQNIKEASGSKLFTRGGQITLHNLRMLFQINKAMGSVYLIVTALLTIFISILLIDFQTALTTFYYYQASIMNFFGDGSDVYMIPIDGKAYPSTSAFIVKHPYFQKVISSFYHKLFTASIISLALSTIGAFALVWSLKRKGHRHGEDSILRGTPLVDVKELIKITRSKYKLSPYSIASVPLPVAAETQHIQIIGTTGSGKTVLIRELLTKIRERGDRAVIYDKGGTYISHFYQEGKDVILNPMDSRGKSWDVWQECEDKADLEAIAEALMPMPVSGSMDPFWITAARMIFVSTAHKLKDKKERSNLLLLQYLLTKDMSSIQHLIKDTESASLVSGKAEKMALSVKSVMATYLKSLMYLKTDPNDFFSIRKWITNEDSNQWLFISSDERKHPTLRPLISTWINTATKELLSLRPDPKRRVWFILDELATLHMLPFLEMVKSESRKFGGCFVLGFHGITQLRKIYGVDGAANLSNLCSTQMFLRLNDDINLKWASQNLGSYEIEEVHEGISYGANTMRDGISISRQIKEKQVALPTEIKQLNDLEGYLNPKGSLPPCKISFPYKTYHKYNPEYVQRKIETSDLSDRVEQLVNHFESAIAIDDSQYNEVNQKNAAQNESQIEALDDVAAGFSDFD